MTDLLAKSERRALLWSMGLAGGAATLGGLIGLVIGALT